MCIFPSSISRAAFSCWAYFSSSFCIPTGVHAISLFFFFVFAFFVQLRPGTRQAAGSGAAFFPAAALGPRVVCRLEVPLSVDPYAFPRATLVPVVLAYDTARPAAGWQEVWATPPEQQVKNDELVNGCVRVCAPL
jgi:hypothetical protein